MEKQTRRSLLKNAAKGAVVAGGLAGGNMSAQKPAAPLEKTDGKAKTGVPKPKTPPLYTDVIAYGNLLFVAGKSQHLKGTIEEQTTWVLDLLEKNLIASGSSQHKVLRVNVYLKNMESDLDKMNETYRKRDWGELPPARSCTSSAGGFPGGPDALLMVDMIAYV